MINAVISIILDLNLFDANNQIILLKLIDILNEKSTTLIQYIVRCQNLLHVRQDVTEFVLVFWDQKKGGGY